MFVPSLSWSNDPFLYIKMAPKNGVVSLPAGVADRKTFQVDLGAEGVVVEDIVGDVGNVLPRV
jgi:hypothetical protein